MTADVTHKYDDPFIGGMDFLLAVLHDPAVSLQLRMDAAIKLLPTYRLPPQIIHIKIVGGLPPEAVIEARTDDGCFAWDMKPRVH